jgi:uncharacterized protein with GYD domain
MSKFMIRASYTTEGTKGVLKEGGTSRRAAVEKALAGVGGKVDSFYFAFGDADAYVICDVPDTASAIAISLTVNASGFANVSTVPLITAEEVDVAVKKSVNYRAPGA